MSGTSPPNGPGKPGQGKHQQFYQSGASPLPRSPPKKVKMINFAGQEVEVDEGEVAERTEFLNSLDPVWLAEMRALIAEQDATAAAANVSPNPVIQGELENPFVSDSATTEVTATFTMTAPGTATVRVRLPRSPQLSSRQMGERHVAPIGAQARLQARAEARRARAREASTDNATSAPAGTTGDRADELAESDDVGQPARPNRVTKRGLKGQKK